MPEFDVGEPRVEAIIVNWNGAAFLERCLAALAAQTVPVRITVVDNGSSDGSAAWLRRACPNIAMIELEHNLGYAAGANAGLRRSRAEYAILLNADVAIAPNHLEVLAARLDADLTIGAAQGKLWQATPEQFCTGRLEPGGRLDSAGHSIRATRMVVDRGQGEADGPRYSREESVFSACGAALFLRRAMLEDLAPDGEFFDESFFAYKEDIDLCWRARVLGWDIRYVPAAVGWHVRGWPGSSPSPPQAHPLEARLHSFKNHYLLLLKNECIANLLRDFPAVLGWELLRVGYAALRDRALFRSYGELWTLLRLTLDRRRALMKRRRVTCREMRRWINVPQEPRG